MEACGALCQKSVSTDASPNIQLLMGGTQRPLRQYERIDKATRRELPDATAEWDHVSRPTLAPFHRVSVSEQHGEAWMADRHRETKDEYRSRMLLVEFLSVSDRVLDRVLGEIADLHEIPDEIHVQLSKIWNLAQSRLRSVIESIRVGLNRKRRSLLLEVGMFGEALAAKFELLRFDIQEGSVKRVFMRLNSMLGSLAIVFHALDAAKEFKEHVEATMDRLSHPPEIIDLKMF